MKHSLLLIFLLSPNITAYCQNEEIIYEMIINDYVLSNRQPNLEHSSVILLILEEPKYMRKFDANNFLRYKEQYKNLDRHTFVDFVEKSKKNVYFERNQFLDIEIVMINREQSNNLNELIELYPFPNWNGSILEFSHIGFNEDANQAFVYFGFEGLGVGSGVYFVLEKKRKKWRYKKVIPSWAS